MTRYCFLIIILIGAFVQCKPKQQTQTGEVNADSLQLQLNALNDSLQISWDAMINSDNQKIRQMDALLKDLSQTCKYDKSTYNQITEEQKMLVAKRYTSPDVLTNEQIDEYDSATDTLLSNLRTFYKANQIKQCCVTCDSLLSDVENLHGEVVMYRIRYDNHAKEFNVLITQQKDVLAQLKPEYRNLKPRQLFSIMQ